MEGQRVEPKPAGGGKGKKIAIAAGIVLGVLACAYVGLCAWVGSSGAIFPHTVVGGVDVSGMTVEQAASALDQAVAQHGDQMAGTITYGDWRGTVTADQMDYDWSASAQAAWQDGRDSFFAQGGLYLARLMGQEHRVTAWSVSADAVDRLVDQMQEELGEDGDNEIAAYRRQIADARLPEEVEEKLLKEVMHLEKQPYGSAEASVLRNYLDVCLELPWTKTSKERASVAAARKILDADHFGLEKVKERILEFVAVKQLAPHLKGQIICLVGPPGVGKTSIGMSMARALNRKLARISLGGVHDEADIRGHRKTYVGAMPGRIINAVRQAGTRNPLILLDEIDKMGSDMRGDPASALLEVLDAEQNATFRDHFVELPFDLSDVLFITTANTTSTIPRPLLDRMEVIELPSYTDEEKLQIAKSYLLPKQLKRHGLKKSQVRMTDAAIRETIVSYTRESGVRVLEREIGALCRKAAMGIVSEEYKQAHVTGDNLEKFLGTRKYHPEKNGLENQVGLVNGLAWTAVGGTLLEAEANVVPGSGKVELTGNLGNVMKESARAAFTYIRSRAAQLGIDTDFYKEKDIHIHFPEGAVPKDGPSAGVTITTAMVSALTGIPVRGDVAMTGEVTLRGRVLPIGGLREKSMAALRNGIHTVLIPQDNEADLEEIDQTVRSALHFIPVSHVDQVLAHALEHPPLVQAEQGEELTATPTEAAPAQTAVTQA